MAMRMAGWRVLIVAVVCLWLAPVAPAKDASSSWTDAAVLEKHLAAACDVVEDICHAKFAQRPTVRISDAGTVARLLLVDFAALPEAMLAKSDRADLADAMASVILGKYDSEHHVIHVQPAVAASIREALEDPDALGLDALRLLLVHEATHALDFKRFDFMAIRRARKTADEHQALNAIVEGHAQWVAAEAARRWTLQKTFDRLAKIMAGDGTSDGGASTSPAAAALLSVVRFAYVQGQAFFTAVGKARGREGVEAALRDPPRNARLIEHPAEYLKPVEREAVDLAGIAESIRPLVGDPAWQVQKQRVLEATLRSQVGRVPAERRAEFLRGFVDAYIITGSVRGEQVQGIGVVLQFESPEDARLFVALERLVVESVKARPPTLTFETKALVDGAGSGGKEHGFTMHRVVHAGGHDVAVHQQSFAVGRIACEVIAMNVPGMDRAVMDPVVDDTALFIRDPAAYAAHARPKPLPFQRTVRIVTIHVLGPDGKPIPRALVTVRRGDEDEFATRHLTCLDGEGTLPVGKESVTLFAKAALDGEGQRLNLAPSEEVEIGPEQTSVELRMVAGRRITGHVGGTDAKPAAGVLLRARSERVSGGVTRVGEVSSARTEADGGFEIVGLPPGSYHLVAMRGEGPFAIEIDLGEYAAGARDLALRLKRLVDVSITVVDVDGTPVPGVSVSARGAQTHSWRNFMTNEKGVARLRGLDPGMAYELEVDVSDAQARDDVRGMRREGWKAADTRIVLRPGWTLRGVVVDKGGEPTAASVQSKTGEGGWRSHSSRADGTFEIRGLPRGEAAQVRAVAKGEDIDFRIRDLIPWTSFKPTREPVRLSLAHVDPSKVLRVRILDGAGKPVPLATVAIGVGSDDDPFANSTSTVVRGGTMELGRPAEICNVRVQRARTRDGTPLPLGPALRTGITSQQREIEIRLPPGRALQGLVKTAAGKPLGGVRVLALPGGSKTWHHGEWAAHDIALTKTDGSFKFVSLGPGPYLLRAVPPPPHVEPEAVLVAPGEETAEIRLGGSIRIHVVDWQERPVAGAYVRVMRATSEPSGGERFTYPVDGHTDATGVVRMRSFASQARIRLEIHAPDGRTDLLPRHVAAWDGLAGTFRLERGYVIEGSVRRGKVPVAGADVMIRRGREGEAGAEKDAWVWAARSDEAGHFVTESIAWGPVRLRAQLDQDDSAADPLATGIVVVTPERAASEHAMLTMLPRDAALHLHVPGMRKGWAGWAVRRGGGRIAFECQENDIAVVENLMHGTYAVYVPDPDDETHCVYATDLTTSDATQELTFVATHAVGFRVAPLAGAETLRTRVVGPASERFDPTRQKDGTYVAEGLPPGTWEIVVFAQVAGRWYEGRARSDGTTTPAVTLKALKVH